MSVRRIFSLRLAVASPVLCQGLSPSGFGVDASFARDERNRPILPADHVKGLFRAAYAQAWPGQETADLFGAPSRPGSFAPERGDIFFTDLHAAETTLDEAEPRRWTPFKESGVSAVTRIQIDDETGIVKTGHLQTIEMIAGYGALLAFVGEAVFYAADEKQAGTIAERLRRCFLSIPAVGAFKTIGFGEVRSEFCALAAATPAPSSASAKSAGAPDALVFEATFDRPVLFDAERTERNVFSSRPVAPGGVVMGALAAKLQRLGVMKPGDAVADALSRIQITHAFPLDEAGQEAMKAFPLSMVADSAGTADLADALLAPAGRRAALFNGRAGAYVTDWKDECFSKASQALGWSSDWLKPTIQRTRVMIDPKTGAAADEMLFAHRMLPSLHASGQPRRWRFEARRRDADQSAWTTIVDALAEGLDGVGKSDARMSVVSKAAATVRTAPEPLVLRDGRSGWAVTLRTPALMLDPDAEWNAEAQYGAYWTWVFARLGASAATLALDAWFTEESLHGGYEAQRRGVFGTGRYHPLVLTNAGSVFLLSVAAAEKDGLAKAMDAALTGGLPPRPPKASGLQTLTWTHTVFVAENGYGAIDLHHAMHQSLYKESVFV